MTLYTEFRPLAGSWPRPLLTNRRRALFDSTYDQTLDLLEREVNQLGTTQIVIQLDLTEADIRNDGLPRAAARPGHPGVIVSFESRWGPLRYMTDEFQGWQNNLRAIALSLEALRKVDRYGVSNDGEQYRGYRALGDGKDETLGIDSFSVDEAAKVLIDGTGVACSPDVLLGSWRAVSDAYKAAAKRLHPDAGGTADGFALANLAYRILARHHGITI